MVVFTHVRPVERRIPARMVETVEKAGRLVGNCASDERSVVASGRPTEDGIDAIVDKSSQL